MAVLYAYTKVSDEYTTYQIAAPVDGSAVELCLLSDGRTVVSVTGELPDQPVQITVSRLVVTQELISEVREKSPHLKLIDSLVDQRIRSKYPLDKELYLARISIGSLSGAYEYKQGEAEEVAAFGQYAEQARLWGKEQRAELGL